MSERKRTEESCKRFHQILTSERQTKRSKKLLSTAAATTITAATMVAAAAVVVVVAFTGQMTKNRQK